MHSKIDNTDTKARAFHSFRAVMRQELANARKALRDGRPRLFSYHLSVARQFRNDSLIFR